jgi:hypothetical protein
MIQGSDRARMHSLVRLGTVKQQDSPMQLAGLLV